MIVLIDCNNFYVSCERIFNPGLKNKPVIVLSNNDGCVISRSEEAKRIGIQMGIPVFKIRDLIHKNKIFVFSSNFTLYSNISRRVMHILKTYSEKIEIYSIDEAFIELRLHKSSYKECKNILNIIEKFTGIPVSIGMAQTKTLAKIAVSLAKKRKDNIFIFNEYSNMLNLFKNIDIFDIWGIGKRYAKSFYKNGIYTVFHLIHLNESWILSNFNINVLKTYMELKGVVCYPIETYKKPKKSITVSRSFVNPILSFDILEKYINDFAFLCSYKMRLEKKRSQSMSVFIQTSFYHDNTYSGFTSENFFQSTDNYIEIVKKSTLLLVKIFKKKFKYKKAGVILNELNNFDSYQIPLFADKPQDKIISKESLMCSIDYIISNFGYSKIKLASQNLGYNWRTNKKHISPMYLSEWNEILDVKI
jgi:DNA polymerase V